MMNGKPKHCRLLQTGRLRAAILFGTALSSVSLCAAPAAALHRQMLV